MTDCVYDGSFEGLLTAVFDVYDYKIVTSRIIPADRYQPDAFAEKREVITDAVKANRVWKGLQKRLSANALLNAFSVYLSERMDKEQLLLDFFRMVFAGEEKVEENFSSVTVLQVTQIGKQLHREKHRLEAFVRFTQLKDNVYFAVIAPDFNVLPLIATHFKDRYADQRWIIYDTKRRYGLSYDLQTVQEVYFDFIPDVRPEQPETDVLDANEELFQQLWQVYFHSVNIPARRNLKLHRQHVPIRYWKYLTEKRIFK